MAKQYRKSRNYCFTDFNMDSKPVDRVADYKYLCYGREIAPSTGKEHWQGFILYKNPRSWNSVRKLFSHIEIMRGSIDKNEKYCKKDDKWEEYGNKPVGQGKRTDIEELKKLKTLREVTAVMRNHTDVRIMQEFLKYHEEKRKWKTKVYWFWGPTDCGKSTLAWEMAGDDAWESGKNLRWWEGYDGHENVVIDDFRPDYCTFHELLRILDRHPYRIEYKGGTRQLLAKKIWITSPKHPEQMYKNRTEEDIGQLLRRIFAIVEFGTEVGGNTKPLLNLSYFSDDE